MAKKILVIDDEPSIMDLIKMGLESKGYEVVYAYNGMQGINTAENETPDLILLDIILPDMHGFEVCKRLKALSNIKDKPIIIMSGTGLEEISRDEPEVQADDYFSKPFSMEDLVQRIEELTGNKS